MEQTIAHLLPKIIMIESLLASIIYVYYNKAGPALYWFAAALLNFSVTYLMSIEK